LFFDYPRNSSGAQIQFPGNLSYRSAVPPQCRELGHGARIVLNTWAATYPAMRSGTLKARNRSLTQSNPFLFRNGRQYADHRFLKNAGAIEKLLGKRSVVDTIAGEPLKVVQRFHGALAAKAVKRPEEQAVELTPGRGREHLPELVTISVLAAGLVLILMDHSPTLGGRELPKLAELIFRVLSAVSGRDSCIYCDSHHALPVPKTNVKCDSPNRR
jgi:hypothetical protein